MSKVIVVLSGGMDSTTLLYDTLADPEIDEVTALSVSYGQRHKVRELDAAKITCLKLNVPHKIVYLDALSDVLGGSALTGDIDVPEGHYEEKNMKLTVVPNRNMILLSIAIGFAISINASVVLYAAHGGDHAIYFDCRPEFVSAMAEVAKICDWSPIEVRAPYLRWDKGDIACHGKMLDVDYKLTWTCYKGGDKPCGKCGACIERQEAFAKAEMEDPLLKGDKNGK